MYRDLRDYCQHVRLSHDEIFLTFKFHLVSGIFAIEDVVSCLEEHLFVFCSASNCDDSALCRFLLACGVRNDDATDFLFRFHWLNQDAVL